MKWILWLAWLFPRKKLDWRQPRVQGEAFILLLVVDNNVVLLTPPYCRGIPTVPRWHFYGTRAGWAVLGRP